VPRRLLVLLALGVAATALSACGGDDGDAPQTAGPASSAAAPATSTPTASAAESTPAETAPATTAAETPASEGTAAETAAASAPTLQELLDLQDANIVTPDVALLGGADFATGVTTRIPFAVIDKDSGEAVRPDGDTAEVYLAPNAETPAIGPFQATWRSLEVPGAKFDAGIPHAVWTADVPLPAEGPYFLVAAYTVDGQQRSANTGLNVQPAEATPVVGSPAPKSQTPTIASTNNDLAALTTADPPDTSLLEHSIADSIAAEQPFVVTFATPKFCQSRICGPIVDIVLDVQKRMAETPMRFIHAEIYKDNNPEQGVAQWVTEWGLVSEPWVFVVDAAGNVTAKFEGAVTADELEAAARAALNG
jgi:hypothetical protein